jgi:hypothetical protein
MKPWNRNVLLSQKQKANGFADIDNQTKKGRKLRGQGGQIVWGRSVLLEGRRLSIEESNFVQQIVKAVTLVML